LARELYEKKTTRESGNSLVVTLYDNGHITLWEDWSVDCSVDVPSFEELKQLAEILNGMVKDIENLKLKENAEKELVLWKCRMCGYIYNETKEEKKVKDLREGDICPNCELPINFEEVMKK